ncbi:hypothetical protein HHI36_020923 [Cryptolaemus montrouzieri]|uniref:Nucleolar protein 16 n=1 Tax=Cryptolaemus montrouzieri TaxID=559131 RepID=A0ABD2NCI9_9CUCU
MTKLRKQRRKKKYRYNINRKRLRNKITNVGKINCEVVSDEWEKHKSTQRNLMEMGLSYDPNQTVKITHVKKNKPISSKIKKDFEWTVEEEIPVEEIPCSKKIVAQKLLEDAKAPRVKMLRLPGSVVEWVTYLMDKYGNDYKSMARDKKNCNQETWKQIRQKIKLFKSIPEHYSEYLKSRPLKDMYDDNNFSSDGEL